VEYIIKIVRAVADSTLHVVS